MPTLARVAVAILMVAAAFSLLVWWWVRPPGASAAFGGELVRYEVLERDTGTGVLEALRSGFDGRVDPQALEPVEGEAPAHLAVVPPVAQQDEWAAVLGLEIPAGAPAVLLIGYITRPSAGHRVVGVEVVPGREVVVHLAEGRCLLPCGDAGIWVAEAIRLPAHDLTSLDRAALHRRGRGQSDDRTLRFFLEPTR